MSKRTKELIKKSDRFKAFHKDVSVHTILQDALAINSTVMASLIQKIQSGAELNEIDLRNYNLLVNTLSKLSAEQRENIKADSMLDGKSENEVIQLVMEALKVLNR